MLTLALFVALLSFAGVCLLAWLQRSLVAVVNANFSLAQAKVKSLSELLDAERARVSALSDRVADAQRTAAAASTAASNVLNASKRRK